MCVFVCARHSEHKQFSEWWIFIWKHFLWHKISQKGEKSPGPSVPNLGSAIWRILCFFFLLDQFSFCKRCLIGSTGILISRYYVYPLGGSLGFLWVSLEIKKILFNQEVEIDKKYEDALEGFSLFSLSLTLRVLGPIFFKKKYNFLISI